MDEGPRDEWLQLLDDLPVIVWEAAVPGPAFTLVSGGAERLLGYPGQRWIDEPMFFPSLMHEEDRDRTLASCAASTARGEDHELEYRLISATGAVHWFHNIVEVQFSETGEVSGIRGVLIDVTQRKQAELARREAEARLTLLADRVEDVLWVRTPERVLYVSPAYETIWGRTCASLLADGTSFLDLVHPEDRGRLEQAFHACLSGAGTFDQTYRVVREDGETRWVHARAGMEPSSEGQVQVGIATDVTKRLQEEESLRQTQKLESLGRLAGGIAHDFNNILVSVLGNADLAGDEIRSGGDATPLLAEIVTAAERASALCRQMLSYSGRAPVAREARDLRKVTRELEGLLRTSLPKTASLSFEFSPQLPDVFVDVTQIHQVLMNLVVNAGEALGGQDGTVRIGVDLTECTPEELAKSWTGIAHAPGARVRLRVTDNGKGMDPESQHRVFDPFFTTKAHGRGLGMATVLGIARSHEGALFLDTQEGSGTTITLLLPLHVEDARSSPTGSRVVLVDSEPPTRELARRALVRAGHSVRVAGDCATALDLLNAERPDVVILDPSDLGPRTDELMRFLDRSTNDVPILLTPSGEVRGTELDGIAGEHLKKPYRASDLQHALSRALNRTP
tara:strand:- start:4651 stop:6519 length:1869 start_codon:yes stop_codon:yes gene_type:complete